MALYATAIGFRFPDIAKRWEYDKKVNFPIRLNLTETNKFNKFGRNPIVIINYEEWGSDWFIFKKKDKTI